MNKKLIASAILGLGLAVSGSASANLIGGIEFGDGKTSHLETTTMAETFVDGVGQTLTGYGVVNTVNGNNAYGGGDQLYFIFNYNVLTFSATGATFDSGVVNIYKRSTFNLLDQDSVTNMDLIDNGTLWGVFSGHAMNGAGAELQSTGTLTGGTLSFTGSGLLDVTGGLFDVVARLNTNTISDSMGGFADIALTTSGNNFVLNDYDDTTGCANGTAAAGTWCIAGSADLRGKMIPEPESLALLGIGLLGMGVSLRKRKVV